MESTSYRTGLALLSLAPLAVACAYSLRTQALRKLNHAVNHDFLTGVLARRALMERGQKLLTRLEEEGQQVAMLMVDIDHFKAVNDRYGHSQGDVVLQEFAVLARDALRPEDLIGRMGGEEFAIMLPRTTHDQALLVGQRLCERLREHVFPLPNQGQMRITLSVGMHSVSCIGPQDSMEHLLSKADEALYVAKNSGRDQVRQYGPALAPSAI
nr:GGDEF domain-containing protein [Comamonas sp. CMM02]